MAKGSLWLKLAGISGIITPIIAFTCIFSAIASYPQFSWTNNALSDLGVQWGITATLFNSGLVIGGILALLFAYGLFKILEDKTAGKIGAFLFVIAALSLICIGIFPKSSGRIHYYVSVAFFTFIPLSALVIGATFIIEADLKMGLFTFIVAFFAALVWIIQWTVGFGRGVAIPEALSAIAASLWIIVVSFKMFREASPNK
ncbi:MAG: DUF998 domain-containing protein [Candidatus Bathycorpusculaceae bacterium]